MFSRKLKKEIKDLKDWNKQLDCNLRQALIFALVMKKIFVQSDIITKEDFQNCYEETFWEFNNDQWLAKELAELSDCLVKKIGKRRL